MTMAIDLESGPTNKVYEAPGRADSPVELKSHYENFIGGQWVRPLRGWYMTDISPVNGAVFCEVARSTPEDVELALDAAHAARADWGRTTLAERADILNLIADAIEANLEMLAVAESWETGKPIRETLAADLPLAVDHFRYFAAEARATEGCSTEIDGDTVAYHFQEPLGVVGQILPFSSPLLMAAWNLAPALGAGNCTVLKPASSAPWSILKLIEIIGPLVPPGVVNVVTGPGEEVGRALASNRRVAKIAFAGARATGRSIMRSTADNIIPTTMDLGGKSPNLFFADVMDEDDDFLEKAIEGLLMFAFNNGEVGACPSRALIEESIYDDFVKRSLDRIGGLRQGNPLDTATQIGAQGSAAQIEKIASYIDIGLDEGARCLIGGHRAQLGGELAGGYYFEPTVLQGINRMRVFQEEIFGPVLATNAFIYEADAVRIANDTQHGLGAGVWTRNGDRAYRVGRAIQAGRVWTNCYHLYPAGAASGGYKMSGIGRESHRMMLAQYSQTKNLIVSYSSHPTGWF